MKTKYTNPKQRPETMTRESPSDFMRAYLEWIRKTGRTMVTPKGFAIIREQERNDNRTRDNED
jgi:hypothetical protein